MPDKNGSRSVSASGIRNYYPALVEKHAAQSDYPILPADSGLPLIRVLLVDPRPLTAEAMRAYLQSAGRSGGSARFHVVAATQLGKMPAGEHFDLLLLHTASSRDIGAEIEVCVNAIPAIYRSLPKVIYSDRSGAEDIAAAINAGARGYLPSSLDSEQIVEALRLLASGLAVFPPAAVSRLADGRNAAWMAGPSEDGAAGDPFTTREREVLEGLHAGKPNKTIARDLGLSQSTVKVHVRSVFRKLGVHNRTEAAILSGEHLAPRPTL